MENLLKIYYFIGSLLCHQIPERTLYINGVPLPVCARDTGVFMGIFISVAFCFLKDRMKCDRLPDLKISVILAVMMIPMMIDGFSSYMNFWDTGNTIRIVTGIMFGMPIPLFLMPTANFKVYENNYNKVIKNWFEAVMLFFIAAFIIALILMSLLPWILISSIFVFSLIFIISRTAYTIFKVSGAVFVKSLFGSVTFTTLLVFGTMYFISHQMFKWVKILLLIYIERNK